MKTGKEVDNEVGSWCHHSILGPNVKTGKIYESLKMMLTKRLKKRLTKRLKKRVKRG